MRIVHGASLAKKRRAFVMASSMDIDAKTAEAESKEIKVASLDNLAEDDEFEEFEQDSKEGTEEVSSCLTIPCSLDSPGRGSCR